MSDEISAFLDGELDDAARAEVAAAVERDPAVRAEFGEVAEIRDLVRGLAPPPLPDGFIERLLTSGGADAENPSAPPGTAAAATDAAVVDLDAARTRRHGGRTRIAAAAVGVAATVAVVLAVALPGPERSAPALATQVRVHQAGTAAAGDPISGLAPLAGPVRFGR
jgi:anti-sigma factor RsiW